MKVLSWANVVLGLWLLIAPFALVYRGIQAALWEDVVVGFLIAVFSLWHATSTEAKASATENWIVGALGLWALVSPFVLRFNGTDPAMWNNVIVGAVVTISAIWLTANPWRHQDHHAH